jgi:hypothetical protein
MPPPYFSPIRELLQLIKIGTSWPVLHDALKDTKAQTVANGAKKPPDDLTKKLLLYCVEQEKKIPHPLRVAVCKYCEDRAIGVPPGFDQDYFGPVEDNSVPEVLEILEKILAEEIENPPPEIDSSNESVVTDTKPEEYTIVSALGLDTTATNRSVKRHHGAYFHFSVLDRENVVTSVCHLSARLGADRAPIYRSWRQAPPQKAVRRYRGGYFAGDDHLYLIASREGTIDFRLSVFHFVGEEPEQEILSGTWLGVPSGEKILSSRSMLVKRDVLPMELQIKVVRGPLAKSVFDGDRVLKEISAYLFGQEPPFIEVSGG